MMCPDRPNKRVTRSAAGSAGDAGYGTIGKPYAPYRQPDDPIAARICVPALLLREAFSGLSAENASANRVEPGFARVSGRRAVPAVSPAAGSPGASRCSASGGGTSGSGTGQAGGPVGCAPQASHLPRAFGDLGGWDVFSADAAQKSSQLPPASPPTPRQSQTPRQYVGTSAAGTLLGSR